MDNLDYLNKIKAEEREWLNNEVIKNLTSDKEWDKDALNYRKVKALEIIAEQIINLDNTLAVVVSTLENIETAIKQRG